MRHFQAQSLCRKHEMCLHQAIWYSAVISITNVVFDVWMGSIILLYEPHSGESTLTEAKADTWYQGEKQRGVWVPQSGAQRKTFPNV